MANANNDKEILYQNLNDAGCNDELIEQCMMLSEYKNTEQMIKLLSEYKKALLVSFHLKEKRIDCLDFLIYRLETECKQEEQNNGRKAKLSKRMG